MMSESTKNYKARFISLITGIPSECLKEATYESNELPVGNKKDKVYKTDILVKIKGHIINLEMNKEYYDGLLEKNEKYGFKINSESLGLGEDYLEAEQIIQINIDNFSKFGRKKLLHEFMMKEVETGEIEYEGYKSYHIDLEYLKNICYNEINNELEKLCYLFKEEDIGPLIKEDKIMEEAYEELERISQDKKIIGLYDAEKVERKVINTRLKSAKLEGVAEGIEEGIEQGSKDKCIEIAKNMLKENSEISFISRVTGLSEKEIEELM